MAQTMTPEQVRRYDLNKRAQRAEDKLKLARKKIRELQARLRERPR